MLVTIRNTVAYASDCHLPLSILRLIASESLDPDPLQRVSAATHDELECMKPQLRKGNTGGGIRQTNLIAKRDGLLTT